MDKFLTIVLIVFFLSLVGVIGDFFLKLSSNAQRPFSTKWFFFGAIVYALSAFGWVFAFRYLKLGTLGVFYSLFTVLFLVILGVFYFNEKFNYYELTGIALAIASIILLARFT